MFGHHRRMFPTLLLDGDEGGGGGAPAGGQEPPKADPPAPKDDPKPPWGSPDEFDPDRAWKLIQDVRTDAEKAKSEREELRKKVQAHEDATKSDQEKLEERAKGLETRAQTAEGELARLRVALKKGLSETQAKRLVGSTEEELEKDADELLASFKQDEGQDPSRRPRERLRPGAAPAAEPDDSNSPAALAAKVPRGW